ncbi:MAG: penicillin-binding protein 1B [Gammaproteobacteria bacterium]|nr:penicillin-binding protein 1B [Gammaproteobacteria bacterium]
MKSVSKKPKAKAKKPSQNRKTHTRRWFSALVVALLVGLAAYLLYLNYLIGARFDGGTWQIPSRVYARPLELYPGISIDLEELVYELGLSTYQAVKTDPEPGQYRQAGNAIEIHSRAFEYSDQAEPAHRVHIEFADDRVLQITRLDNAAKLDLLRLPPVVIGSYHPGNGEDRVLLKIEDVPPQLIEILIAVEDRKFFQHFGVDPVSIGRALLANIKAGKTVQGGSTLTQQLAKNLFLTPERSLTRKVNEAFMAVLLEMRFSKESILTAYLNEVFLLQQDNISINGFSLASRMLFKQSLAHLSNDKLALLVGMVKGPTRYNPIIHPVVARERRSLVLRIMRDHKLIDESEYRQAIKRPLGTVKRLPGVNPFPAYLDLVKRQLNRSYSASELSSKGLRIFTPFDPLLQRNLEQGLKAGLNRFEATDLQSAVVISDYFNGDIRALTGDREVDFPGFNRAIMAQRPIGSLIKPLLLYSLLENNKYSLASQVDDRPIRIKQLDEKIWEPRNYDRKQRGKMSLYQAFVNSYNLPFVHLGVQGGLQALSTNLEKIGLLKHNVIYPSILLGTTAMSAFEVAQMYQVIASNGYFSPLTTIRRVTDIDNHELNRIPVGSLKLFDESVMLQVQRALIGVAEEGTAKYLNKRFEHKTIAGKTGTTNDARDSWFAGFSERLLTVVWLGKDDNSPISLSGSSGALRVWADIMDRNGFSAFKLTRDDSLEWRYINRFNGKLSRNSCVDSVLLPFTRQQIPGKRASCEP